MKWKKMENGEIKVEGWEGMKQEGGEHQKGDGTESKNASLPSVHVWLTQRSGSESSTSLSYKKAVTHSSALHPFATEER